MDILRIEPSSGKGRCFQGSLVGYIDAPTLYDSARNANRNIRPVLLAVAATKAQSRPFVSNLQLGAGAKVARNPSGSGGLSEGRVIEVLRSGGFAAIHQDLGTVVASTLFLPDLFVRDPGMVDPSQIGFIVAPPADSLPPVDPVLVAWAMKAQPKANKHGKALPKPEDAARVAPYVQTFFAMLDRRTRAPIPPDPRFRMQFLMACLREGLAGFLPEVTDYREKSWGSYAGEVCVHNAAGMGLRHVLAMRASHEAFTDGLVEEVGRFAKLAS